MSAAAWLAILPSISGVAFVLGWVLAAMLHAGHGPGPGDDQ